MRPPAPTTAPRIHAAVDADVRTRDDATGETFPSALDELMTAQQVAMLLLLPISTVMDYARRGVLPSIKLGKHRRFVRSQVEGTIEALARPSPRPSR
jgi:excisionase family DNA binding protein